MLKIYLYVLIVKIHLIAFNVHSNNDTIYLKHKT